MVRMTTVAAPPLGARRIRSRPQQAGAGRSRVTPRLPTTLDRDIDTLLP